MAKASDISQIGFNSRQADFLGHTELPTISALGTTQGAATPLTGTLNEVSTGSAGVNDGVLLPLIARVKKYPIGVYNRTGGDIKIYPGVGEFIMGLGANNPATLANASFTLFFPFNGARWLQIT